MNRKHYLALTAILTLTISCVTTHYVNEVTKGGDVVIATVTKVLDRNKNFEIFVTLSNQTDKPVLTFFGSMGCSKGTLRGELQFRKFGIGERAIDLKPYQSKKVSYRCRLPDADVPGSFLLTYGPILSNPTGDGKTAGAVLVEKLDILVEHKEVK